MNYIIPVKKVSTSRIFKDDPMKREETSRYALIQESTSLYPDITTWDLHIGCPENDLTWSKLPIFAPISDFFGVNFRWVYR